MVQDPRTEPYLVSWLGAGTTIRQEAFSSLLTALNAANASAPRGTTEVVVLYLEVGKPNRVVATRRPGGSMRMGGDRWP